MTVGVVLNKASIVFPTVGPTAGAIYIWGDNQTGQCADGTFTNNVSNRQPVAVPTHTFIKVVGGGGFYFGLKSDNTLYTWGDNSSGQLGLGDTTNRSTPVQVTSPTSSWLDVGCGADHSVALDMSGLAYATGVNTNGNLGTGTGDVNTFTSMTGGNVFTQIAAGADSTGGGRRRGSIALKSDGSVWYCGRSDQGQGGSGGNVTAMQDVGVTSGSAFTTGYTAIMCTGLCTFAMRSDGTIYGIGYNGSGELGIGSTTNAATFTQQAGAIAFTKMCTSFRQAFALKSDGTVYAWGTPLTNSFGNNTSMTTSPTIVKDASNANVGPFTDIGCTKFIQPNSWVSVFGLKSDGSLWGWGSNDGYQLTSTFGGSNTQTPQAIGSPTTFTRIPESISYADGAAIKV